MEDKYFYISLAVAILILGSLGFTGYVFWNKENSDMLGNCEFIDKNALSATGISYSGKTGNEICTSLNYNRCFLSNIRFRKGAFDSTDGSCQGKLQDVDDISLSISCDETYEVPDECDLILDPEFTEPENGDIMLEGLS